MNTDPRHLYCLLAGFGGAVYLHQPHDWILAAGALVLLVAGLRKGLT